MNLHARNIDELVNECLALSDSLFDDPELSADSAQVVVSPYRFNPLGAHIAVSYTHLTLPTILLV